MKILCVIDCQNDFITGALRNEEAIKKIPNIVEKIRKFDGDRICVTTDTHFDNYLETREGIALPVKHCIAGSDGWNIEPNVKAALHDASLRNISVIYIEKPTFGSYELVNNLRLTYGRYADVSIELIGFCTDICVVSNAILLKAAFYNNADIFVDASCCAGVTPETHDAALKTMKMCQINIID